MLELRAGARANDAVQALREAGRTGGNVLGGNDSAPERILSAYRRWIGGQIVQVGQWLSDAEQACMLTTRRYWSLVNLDPATFQQGDLADFVRLEIRERIRAFEVEAENLSREQDRWGSTRVTGAPDTIAVVLDTNVLLTHHAELDTFPWRETLGLRRDRHLGLAIPIEVIRELDRHKMANNNTLNRGTRNELRRDAGAALRFVEDHVDDVDGKHWLETWKVGGSGDLSIMLVANKTPGPPISDPDSEIIDRARSLQPFALDVHFISYDAAAAFQARQSGVKAMNSHTRTSASSNPDQCTARTLPQSRCQTW